jgi:hypothetical protein
MAPVAVAAGSGRTAAALAAAAARAAASWGEVGLDTSATDRAAAEAGVRAAYRAAGLAEPAHVVWLGSPRAGAVGASALLNPMHWPEPDPSIENLKQPGPVVAAVEAALAAQGCRPGDVVPGRALRGVLRNVPWAAARAQVRQGGGLAGQQPDRGVVLVGGTTPLADQQRGDRRTADVGQEPVEEVGEVRGAVVVLEFQPPRRLGRIADPGRLPDGVLVVHDDRQVRERLRVTRVRHGIPLSGCAPGVRSRL